MAESREESKVKRHNDTPSSEDERFSQQSKNKKIKRTPTGYIKKNKESFKSEESSEEEKK